MEFIELGISKGKSQDISEQEFKKDGIDLTFSMRQF